MTRGQPSNSMDTSKSNHSSTSTRTLITNAVVIDPVTGPYRQGQPTSVALDAGKILAIGNIPSGFQPDHSFDAQGRALIPGLVDLSVRLREPGFEYKATLESELKAAAAGGVTTVVCPPDTDPVLDESGLVEMLRHRAQSHRAAKVLPLGALTIGLQGKAITEMAQLREAGCIGFSQAEQPIADTQVLYSALQYAATFGFTVWLRPHDPWVGRGVAHAGAYASRMGLLGVPVIAETIALQTIFTLVRATGCRVHLCRLSSADGVALVRQAKREGLPVTADVAVHHLHLIDLDIAYFDSNARVDPPFRERRDCEAIAAALLDGTIDFVCSDHTPVDDDAKCKPFAEAEPGVTGLELLLSLMVRWAQQRNMPWHEALRWVTSSPAGLLAACGHATDAGLGRLVQGGEADLALVDPQAEWLVSQQSLLSQGRHTPFLGYPLPARVMATWVGGRLIWERCE